MCIYVHLNPTAVTEDVGLSPEPVYVSLMTSGGSLARLNMVAFAKGGQIICSLGFIQRGGLESPHHQKT